MIFLEINSITLETTEEILNNYPATALKPISSVPLPQWAS